MLNQRQPIQSASDHCARPERRKLMAILTISTLLFAIAACQVKATKTFGGADDADNTPPKPVNPKPSSMPTLEDPLNLVAAHFRMLQRSATLALQKKHAAGSAEPEISTMIRDALELPDCMEISPGIADTLRYWDFKGCAGEFASVTTVNAKWQLNGQETLVIPELDTLRRISLASPAIAFTYTRIRPENTLTFTTDLARKAMIYPLVISQTKPDTAYSDLTATVEGKGRSLSSKDAEGWIFKTDGARMILTQNANAEWVVTGIAKKSKFSLQYHISNIARPESGFISGALAITLTTDWTITGHCNQPTGEMLVTQTEGGNTKTSTVKYPIPVIKPVSEQGIAGASATNVPAACPDPML